MTTKLCTQCVHYHAASMTTMGCWHPRNLSPVDDKPDWLPYYLRQDGHNSGGVEGLWWAARPVQTQPKTMWLKALWRFK